MIKIPVGLVPVSQARALLDHSERMRVEHERPSVDTGPVSFCDSNVLPDYATCGLLVSDGIAQMDESVPSGQKERTEAAYRAAAIGMAELGNWLRARGFDV